MKVAAITNNENDSRRNMFIRLSNSFMSQAQIVNPIEKANNANKGKMGIENLEEFTIFPKQVVDGKMVITA